MKLADDYTIFGNERHFTKKLIEEQFYKDMLSNFFGHEVLCIKPEKDRFDDMITLNDNGKIKDIYAEFCVDDSTHKGELINKATKYPDRIIYCFFIGTCSEITRENLSHYKNLELIEFSVNFEFKSLKNTDISEEEEKSLSVKEQMIEHRKNKKSQESISLLAFALLGKATREEWWNICFKGTDIFRDKNVAGKNIDNLVGHKNHKTYLNVDKNTYPYKYFLNEEGKKRIDKEFPGTEYNSIKIRKGLFK